MKIPALSRYISCTNLDTWMKKFQTHLDTVSSPYRKQIIRIRKIEERYLKRTMCSCKEEAESLNSNFTET